MIRKSFVEPIPFVPVLGIKSDPVLLNLIIESYKFFAYSNPPDYYKILNFINNS